MSNRNRLIVTIILIFIVSVLTYNYYNSFVSKKEFEKHFGTAEKLEKQGKFKEALQEYNKALSLVGRNDDQKRRLIIKRIEEVKRKNESERRTSTNNSEGASKLPSSNEKKENSNSTSTKELSVVFHLKDLGKLLPDSFDGLKGDITSSTEVATVRFDDISSRTNYFIYVYKHTSSKGASEFIETSKEKIFNLKIREVELIGEFKGFKGYYGENAQGDSALYFSYGNLIFEILMRTETLKPEERLGKLLSLQEKIKKPQ
ncbi:MAG: hypothetical protein N2440_06210 [Actinobacteria bacterium]|nr:hypothetical protein [Actinomycetota bacterium]